MREITRAMAIKALDSMWGVAFPERSQERLQDWAEGVGLCEYWDPDIDEEQPESMPPGIWDILIALGVTPQELHDHVGANLDIFKDRAAVTENASES